MDDEERRLNPMTTTSVVSKNCVIANGKDDEQEKVNEDADCSSVYEPCTFRPNSINSERRRRILPAYPLARDNSTDRTLLLLCNVPHVNREMFENKSFCGGHGFCPFNFVQHRYVEAIDSFMIDLYRDLFERTSRQWKIPCSIIDYNLSRLRTCMQMYTQQTNEPAVASLSEWPLALEYFLQIDGKNSIFLSR